MKKLAPFFFIALFLFQACTSKKQLELSDPNLFKDFITSYTSGMISTRGTIQVGLKNTPEDWLPQQELKSDYFSIEPRVKGKVFYNGNNTLSFVPEQPLKQKEQYRISLHLSKFEETDKEHADFHFMVLTMPLNIQVSLNDFQSITADTYLLNGRLDASDWMSKEQVSEILNAQLDQQDLKINVAGADKSEATSFDFSISDIKRKNDVQKLTVSWDYNKDHIQLKGLVEENIPELNNFKAFKTIQDDGAQQQSFHINFSEPIKKNQNLEGLITSNHSERLSFSVTGNTLKVSSDTPFNQTIEVVVHPGIESDKGLKTNHSKTFELPFEAPKPEIRLIKSGTILPSSQNLKLNFQTVSLRKVDVKVYQIFENNVLQFLQDNNLDGKYSLRKVGAPIATKTLDLNPTNTVSRNWESYALDLSTLIEPESGAIYRVEFSFKKSYSSYACPLDTEAEEEEVFEKSFETNDLEEDYYYSSYYYENYRWEERDNPCHISYYYDRDVATNILASDLGVIVKKGASNTYTFIVNNLLSTEPVTNAKIEVYSYQQQLLKAVQTNSVGIATLDLEKPAYFAVIKKGPHTTYVRLDDGNALSISNFEVDGTSLQKGLLGYLYTERGVWRPGDSIHLGFIIDDSNAPLPEKHPIRVRLTDPYGKVVLQQTHFKTATNHMAFNLPTDPTAPTGNWEAQVSMGGAKFYKRIKIETIKPNRLKIKNNIEGALIKAGVPTPIDFDIHWLQGSPAKNLKAEVRARLRPLKAHFKGFENYTFHNSLSAYYQDEIHLYSGRTDANGSFSFSFPKIDTEQNTSMLQLLLTTQVHETGGDVSTDVSSLSYSPFHSYVGIKAPEGNKYGTLETGVKNTFALQTLSAEGKGLSVPLQVDVYRMDWRWWWDASDYGISNYSASQYHQLYSSTNLQSNAQGKANFDFQIPDEDWGRYEIVVTNQATGHIASSTFYIDMPYWSGKTKNTPGDEAVSLSIALDQDQYQVQDQAQISFPSSAGGRALISIENGSQILKTLWVTSTKGETVFELDITENMAPNAYVHITYLQPHATTLNDAPIRLYGIIPLYVHNKNSVLEPTLKMPESLQPEQSFKIEVAEKKGQPMSYTLAIVEEGLLDLTRFATPDPWNSFYAKTALGVRTWDIYNDVIGAYGGTINQVFSIGGDEDLGAGQVKKANRFKPVVIFLGPFHLDAGKKATHTVKLPNYIGSVRAMVVASNPTQRAYGKVDKTVAVKKPLMVLGSLPRRVVTGEKITLPVTVFAMENNIKEVNVQVKTDNRLKLVDSSRQTLYFKNPDEKVAYFDLAVGAQTGVSKIAIEVGSGTHRASYDVELEVMNPNPESFMQKSIVLEGKQTVTIDWETFGIQNTNKAVVELSTFPGVNLNSRLNYLIQYPHGCSEQITSGVFPQLYLGAFTPLSSAQQEAVNRNIKMGIQKLAANQLNDGSFTYWTGARYYDDWATSYIGHFFIEAENKGFVLPVNSKRNWIAFQQKTARQWRFNNQYGNDLAQSYRLYTLALAGVPELASMNRLRETTSLSNDAKLRLGAAYALAGQKEIAMKLLGNSTWDQSNDYYFGSTERSMAMALESYLALDLKVQAHQVALQLATKLSSNEWMSTQTTAYALNAISKYLLANPTTDQMQLKLNHNGQAYTVHNTKGFAEQRLKIAAKDNQLTIENQHDSRIYVNLNYSGILPVGEELATQKGLALKAQYKSITGVALNPQSLVQGTEFLCEITIQNERTTRVDNVALTHIIPSGWEIVNWRHTEIGEELAAVDHTDIRDDRTHFYFSLAAKQSKVFTVRLQASYLGHYYLPGIQANAMYDGDYVTRTTGSWIDVTPEL